jgi:hypothetical protein
MNERTKRDETAWLWEILSLTVIGGTKTAMAVHPQQALAHRGNGSGC